MPPPPQPKSRSWLAPAALGLLAAVVIAAAASLYWHFTRFDRFVSADAIAAFRDARLEVGALMPVETAGPTPQTHREGTRFMIPSLGQDSGGRVFSFETQRDLDAKQAYYDNAGRNVLFGFSWVFTHRNLLLQINGSLPRAEAIRYRDALLGL